MAVPCAVHRWLLAAAAVTVAAASSSAGLNPEVLQLSGVCDARYYLNSALFEKEGLTANGSPYYKAKTRDLYIYFDADCAGGGDGTPRWIMDTDKPSLDHLTDLDDDQACEYVARINSPHGGSHPPLVGTWLVECGGVWQENFLALMADPEDAVEFVPRTQRTTTAEPLPQSETTAEPLPPDEATAEPTPHDATTAKPTTARPTPPHPTTAKPAPPARHDEAPTETTTKRPATAPRGSLLPAGQSFEVRGACEEKAYLGTLEFVQQGTTATGAPYYASTALDQYIYYDPRCAGASDEDGAQGALWIIDTDEPSTTSEDDLDGDGQCAYHARTAGEATGLPAKAVWRMWCGSRWTEVTLKLSPVDDAKDAPMSAAVSSRRPASLLSAAVAAAAAAVCLLQPR